MSQADLSQGTFDVIWDDFCDYNSMSNQNSPSTAVAEMTSNEFFQEQGFDINVLFTDTTQDPCSATNLQEGPCPTNTQEDQCRPINDNMLTATPILTDILNNDPIIDTFPTINSPAPALVQSVSFETTSEISSTHTVQNQAEFIDINSEDVRKLIQNEDNKNTLKKTLSDVSKFERFLSTKHETRNFHEIESDILDEYLANYILSVRKPDGGEYEPSTIRNMISSIDRKLRRHQYPHKIFSDQSNVFQLCRDALHAKQKSLKRL